MSFDIKFVTNKTYDTYIKNMESIKINYPQYYEVIDKTEINKNYKVVLSENNKYNIFNLGNKKFYYDNKDPYADAGNQIKIINPVNYRIPVLLGFGFGYELEYFTENLALENNTRYIVVIEKDVELFKLVLHFKDITPMLSDKRIRLILGETPHNCGVELKNFFGMKASHITNLKCTKPIYHETSINWFGTYYMDVLKNMKDTLMFIMNYIGNDPEDSLIGVENMLNNIEEIIDNPGINLLYNQFKKVPAVVVATGPSLNKNKELLHEIKDKAMIISVDASLKLLLDMGIKPHLVTSLERNIETAELFEGIDEEKLTDTYLAACPVVMNEVYQEYKGPKVIVYRKFAHFTWLNIDRGMLDIKHSAGNMAFKVADAMGCDPIILIGQDLAFSRDGRTHASGAHFGEVQPMQFKEDIIEVMGNDGQPINTNYVWNLFRKGYEYDIAESNCTCINATEGGAFVNGTKVMTFREAIDTCEFNDENVIDRIHELLRQFTKDNARSDKENLIPIMEQGISDLKLFMDISKDIHTKIADLEEDLHNFIYNEGDLEIDVEEFLKEILASKVKIMGINPTFKQLILHIFQSYHVKFEMDAVTVYDTLTGEKASAKLCIEHKRWFAVLHDLSDMTMNVVIKSYDKAKSHDI